MIRTEAPVPHHFRDHKLGSVRELQRHRFKKEEAGVMGSDRILVPMNRKGKGGGAQARSSASYSARILKGSTNMP